MADVEIDLEISNPQELVGLGIRAYAIGDFANAAAAFGRATQLMAEKNGDEHDSLGEIYVQYARSLLEVSREEGGPIGDAIPHGDESSESSEESEDQNGTEKTDEENKDVANGEKEDTSKDDLSKDASKEDLSKEASKEDLSKEDASTEEESSKEEEQTNGECSKPEEDEENCTDLQLAWEVLEVAKKIFTNRGEAGKDHLAETLILLGEVAMESENFQDGISDMKSGIDLQKDLFGLTSRKLAESYYKLGIAQSTISNIDEAVDSFNQSIEVLKNRIKFLKESNSEKTEDGKSNKMNEEIEEMEKLIPEIEEKIADTKSIKEEMAVELLKEMAGAGDNKLKTPSKEEAGSSSSSKPKDISHLVKRKRKADEDTPESENQPAKKPTP